MKVLVLNADMTILGVTSYKRAICMVVKGIAEVVASSDKKVNKSTFIPSVIKLVKVIRQLWKKQVPWNKHNTHIRDNFTCQYCGKKLTSKTATIDHIRPVSRGGGNKWNNTVCSCFPCNNKKGSKLPSEANMTLTRTPYQPTIMEFLQLKARNNNLYNMLSELIGDKNLY